MSSALIEATTGAPGFTKAQFLRDVAKVLRIGVDELDDVDDPFLAGMDSLRLMVLVEGWRKQGVSIAFIDLAERKSLDAWWDLIACQAR